MQPLVIQIFHLYCNIFKYIRLCFIVIWLSICTLCIVINLNFKCPLLVFAGTSIHKNIAASLSTQHVSHQTAPEMLECNSYSYRCASEPSSSNTPALIISQYHITFIAHLRCPNSITFPTKKGTPARIFLRSTVKTTKCPIWEVPLWIKRRKWILCCSHRRCYDVRPTAIALLLLGAPVTDACERSLKADNRGL